MIIKGEKTVLRPIKLSDAPRFVKWFADPEVTRFLSGGPVTLTEERKWIRGLAKQKKQLTLAIETKDGVHIGSIGFHKINTSDKNATFGISIGDKRYWNQGYGTDAMRAFVHYGFQKLKLHRIDLEVYENNPRAIAVYTQLGFKKEGVKRERVLRKGKFYDSIIMGVLEEEWRKKHGGNTRKKHIRSEV